MNTTLTSRTSVANLLQADSGQILKYCLALYARAHVDAYLPNRAVLDATPEALVDAYDSPAWGNVVDDISNTATKAANFPLSSGYVAPLVSIVGPSDWSESKILRALSVHADPLKRPSSAPPICVIEAFTLSVRTAKRNASKLDELVSVIGKPTLIVDEGDGATDNGYIIAHWRLTEPASGYGLLKLHEARRLAALTCNGDLDAANPAYAFRVPGTWNRSRGATMVTIIALDNAVQIDLSKASEALSSIHAQ